MRIWSLLLIAGMVSFAMCAEEAPTLKCEVGPVTKQYGGTDWLGVS